ncbi:hypothetical protein ACSBR1_039538 [Camellia fascicularis]
MIAGPKTFFTLSVETLSWERLDVGALVSHDFELESEVQALFYGAPAVITFRIPTKAALQLLGLLLILGQ